MLSTATLEAAHAKTAGPLKPALPFLPFLFSSRAKKTHASTYAQSARVLPVPGGPCHTDSVRVSARRTAVCWLAFSVAARVPLTARFTAPAESLPAHGGGVAARRATLSLPSRGVFGSPSGMPMAALCSGAYIEELSLLPVCNEETS